MALGLLEGAYLGASSIFLRPLTGYTSSRITFRREEASWRLLRAPQLTSYTGIYRAESLALSGEGAVLVRESLPCGEAPRVQMPRQTLTHSCPSPRPAGVGLEDVLGPPGSYRLGPGGRRGPRARLARLLAAPPIPPWRWASAWAALKGTQLSWLLLRPEVCGHPSTPGPLNIRCHWAVASPHAQACAHHTAADDGNPQKSFFSSSSRPPALWLGGPRGTAELTSPLGQGLLS